MINLTVKRIIDSQYFKLEDVHRFNKFIKNLDSGINIYRTNTSMALQIVDLLNISKPYEKLTDYVPDSPSFIKLKSDYADYESAQMVLSKCKHKIELIVNEDYPKTLKIFRNTYEDMYYDQDDDQEYSREFVFYTKEEEYSYKYVIIKSFDNLLLPYYNHYRFGDDSDLIENHIREYDSLYNQVYMLKLCNTLGISEDTFKKIFGYHVDFFTYKTESGEEVKLNQDEFAYRSRVYKTNEVIKLIEESKTHRETVKLIKDDKFIDYPRDSYIDVLMGIENGRYKVYEKSN